MPSDKPKIGKISGDVFTSFLLHRLGKENPTVLVPPGMGIDAGVIDIGSGNVLVIAEDPILAIPKQPLDMFGWYAVHIGASDVAVMGVEPQYMTYSLLMPPTLSELEFRTIVDSIHTTARDLNISIVGGHTGYYPGFAAPTIGGITVFAITKRDGYVTPAGANPGDDVLLTKGPAIETAGILSVLREDELFAQYAKPRVRRAQALCWQMSVVKDALTAMKAGGVTAMHDATEGGVIGGLYEICAASGVGMQTDEALFIVPDGVRIVCDAFHIDPVTAIAEGSLLITAHPDHTRNILLALKEVGIDASAIGRVTDNPKTRIMRRKDGSTVPLAMPEQDPFWPVFFEGLH